MSNDIVITLILGLIYILAGGYFIGCAVSFLKNKNHVLFGINLMMAIWFVILLFRRLVVYAVI